MVAVILFLLILAMLGNLNINKDTDEPILIEGLVSIKSRRGVCYFYNFWSMSSI
jgi:hypothetical protein